MILSRLIYFIFRVAEFITSAVVLGIMAYFIHRRRKYGEGPLGRSIYTLIVAILGVLLSLLWMLPFSFNMLHYPADFFLTLAFFAAFGVLVNYIHDIGCGNAFHWGGLTNGSYCSQWKAAEAFSFIAACFFLASTILGVYVYHKLRRRETAAAAPRRGFLGRRRV